MWLRVAEQLASYVSVSAVPQHRLLECVHAGDVRWRYKGDVDLDGLCVAGILFWLKNWGLRLKNLSQAQIF